MSKCQKDRYNGRCCCTCRYRITDNHHCTTSPDLRKSKGGCVCGEFKGYICLAPEFEVAYSGWSEHGMCEMHEFKENNQ